MTTSTRDYPVTQGDSLRHFVSGTSLADPLSRFISLTGAGTLGLYQSAEELLQSIVQLLPQTISDIEVAKLRSQYPPLPAAEDPATHEFEAG